MPSGLKIIIPVVGVAGGAGGIIYATTKPSGNLVTAPADPSYGSHSNTFNYEQGRSLQAQLHQSTKKGDCTIVDGNENPIFTNLHIDEDDYAVIHCREDSSKAIEGNTINQWTGLLPTHLLKPSFKLLMVGMSSDLRMEKGLISNEDGVYKITFESDQFSHSPVVGRMEKGERTILSKKVTTVKVTSQEYAKDKDIYLLLNQTLS